MNSPSRKTWFPFALLAAALVAWAALFAAGAYLELGADQPQRDLRKPLIVMGTMAVFLFVWGLALWARSRRVGK
jgi:type VI protein secretion system component VasK